MLVLKCGAPIFFEFSVRPFTFWSNPFNVFPCRLWIYGSGYFWV